MRKYLAVAATLALAAMPALAAAAEFRVGDKYSSAPSERVSGGLYIAAGSASVGAAVSGDLWIAAGDVSVTGPISGDAAITGGSAQLLSAIQGDVRAAGGQISLNSRVGGDMVVAGGSVHILPDGVVDGGLYVMGGTVTVDGTVRGPVRMTGGRLIINGAVLSSVDARLDDTLSVGPGARINGDVTYRSPSQAAIDGSARITGDVHYEPVVRGRDSNKAPLAILLVIVSALTAMQTLALLGLAALLVWRWRREVLEVLQDAHDRFLPSLGHGLAYAILVPIAAVLLLISIVGTLAGGLLMALYAALMVLSQAMAGLLLGAWLWRKLHKGTVLHLEWSAALVGVVLLELLSLLPVVGWLLRMVLGLVVFGALAARARRALS